MKKFILIAINALVFTLVCNAQTVPFHHEDGIASWYGTEFDGQITASGEVFNSNQYTAAHPSLPFGTLLTITNKDNNKKVTVRVNDRGPFISNRNIDLSKAAAEHLDMIASGSASVSIDSAEAGAALGPLEDSAVAIAPPLPAASPPQQPEAAPSDPAPPVAPVSPSPQASPAAPPPQQPAPAPSDPAPPVAPPVVAPPAAVPPPAVTPAKPVVIKPALPPAGTNKRYRLQIGAYKLPKNAVFVFEKLKSVGLNPAYERSGDFYRVVLPGIKADDVRAVAEKIGQAGFTEALIREEP